MNLVDVVGHSRDANFLFLFSSFYFITRMVR